MRLLCDLYMEEVQLVERLPSDEKFAQSQQSQKLLNIIILKRCHSVKSILARQLKSLTSSIEILFP